MIVSSFPGPCRPSRAFCAALTVGLLWVPLSVRAAAQMQQARQPAAMMTPKQLEGTLAARPSGAEAAALAQTVRTWFGAENLKRGPNRKRTS